MQNRWIHAPAFHSPAGGHARRVGWLELFYDLIYVATFIQLGNALSDNIGLMGFLAVAGLLAPLWLTWSHFTFFMNRFVVDDLAHRAIVFAQMFAIGTMAVCVPLVFEGRPGPFVVAYAVARLVIAALYGRAWARTTGARDVAGPYAIGFGFGAICWIISLALPAPWSYTLWAVAFVVDVAIPFTHRVRTASARHPVDMMHMAERYGLLTIIVLGESFVKVLSALTEAPEPAGEHALMAAFGLILTASLWWLYFDDIADSRIKERPINVVIWVWTHLPLTIAMVSVGVAIKKMVFFDPGLVADGKYRWMLCGTLTLAFLSVTVLDMVTQRHNAQMSDRLRVQARFIACAALVLMAFIGGFLQAWIFIMGVALICVLEVIFDLSMAPLAPSAESAHVEAHHYYTARARAQAAPVDPQAAPARRRQPVGSAVHKGTPSELRRDFYFYFIEGPWNRLLLAMVLLFLGLNVLFAALYMIEPGSVSSLRADSFLDAFAFSVQTMSTIGYGAMSPDTPYAHTLVTLQAVIGLAYTALFTGLAFAKFSLPTSSVLFIDKLVVMTHHGQRTLMFRVGNARGNAIVEATMRVAVLIDEVSPEGEKLRRLHDLKLVRSSSPMFALSWTIMHVIDEHSPLHGVDADNVEERVGVIVGSLTGLDTIYQQTTHARHSWYPEDIAWGYRMVDIISRLPDGRMQVDYDIFHDVEPEAKV